MKLRYTQCQSFVPKTNLFPIIFRTPIRHLTKRLFGAYAQKSDTPQYFLGHNPKGRLAVSAIFLTLVIMGVTGLVLAGTDIYFPPFGAMIQEWVAASGVNPSDILPYVKDNVDTAEFAEMRSFRKVFLQTHYWTFFVVLGLIILHISAVIYAEVKSGGGLISAMFNGKKVLPRVPEDK